MFAAFAALTLVCALGFETHTAAFSDNRVANEITANGASSFFRALRTNEIDYHTYYASRSSAREPEGSRVAAERGARHVHATR